LVFKTNSLSQGWDGRFGSIISSSGTYVWILKAEDLAGKVYTLKGTVNLISGKVPILVTHFFTIHP
jgi:hypothetical protein